MWGEGDGVKGGGGGRRLLRATILRATIPRATIPRATTRRATYCGRRRPYGRRDIIQALDLAGEAICAVFAEGLPESGSGILSQQRVVPRMVADGVEEGVEAERVDAEP